MKKINYIIVALLAALALSVSSCYDDSALKDMFGGLDDRVSKLEKTVAQLNKEYSSLKMTITALEGKVYVQKVDKSDDGITIHFTDNTTAFISNGRDGAQGPAGDKGEAGQNGQDGKAPVISVKLDQASGKYCWTVDGQFIEVDGKKVPATGDTLTPQLKSEGGHLYISWDGKEWEQIAGAPVLGVFKSVDTSDKTKVVFTLQDGSTFEIPIAQQGAPLGIKLRDGSTVWCLSDQLSRPYDIPFTVPGFDKTTSVDFITSGEMAPVTLKQDPGLLDYWTLTATLEGHVPAGKIMVVANRGSDGAAAAATVSFKDWTWNNPKFMMTASELVLTEASSRYYKAEIPADAIMGDMITVDTNRCPFFIVDKESTSWITVTNDTKPVYMPDFGGYFCGLDIKENTTGAARQGKIYLTDMDQNIDHTFCTLFINQAAK